ncbi:Lrp/AsnC family transcriptional regulator [Streptomyces formicae]|uniref:Lrp/AsnC family transcriptional regulator n=1 Tax=Streptomyces formicae TaxID=1616117 RepID=A0ABY3WW48_9ACTN|nr:Lrp/AsnC family transcriptional regulator [Streptomyces formicae]
MLCAAGWVTGGRSPRLRLEEAGVISGYRARVDAEAAGRAFEVVVAVEIGVNDLQTVERLESLLASYDEVIECRRLFGRPDYFIRVAVADHAAYETFLTTKLIGLPAVIRVDSHLIMKKIKGDD